MINEYYFLSQLYFDLYDWLSGVTPGEHNSLRFYNYYEKKVWIHIKNKICELEQKKNKTKIDKDFLKCKYIGIAFRVLNNYSKRRGQLYPINKYQSCSLSIESVKNVSISGNVTLVTIDASPELCAIDIFELLIFMKKYNLIREEDLTLKNINNLLRYEDEGEVVVPITKDNIINMQFVNFKDNKFEDISKDKWFRNVFR